MPPSPLMIAEASSRRGKTQKFGTLSKAIALRKKKLEKEMNDIRRGIKSVKAVKLSKKELAKIMKGVQQMVNKEVSSTVRRSARVASRKNKSEKVNTSLSNSKMNEIAKSASKKTLKLSKNSLPPALRPSVFNPKYSELQKKYDAAWKKHLSLIKDKQTSHGTPPRENANATVNSLANIFSRAVKTSNSVSSNPTHTKHHLYTLKRNSKSLQHKLKTIAENANE